MNRKKNLDPVRNRVIFSSSLLMALSPHFYLISVAPESLNNLGTLPQSVARYTGEYEIVEHGLYTDMEKQIHAARDFNGWWWESNYEGLDPGSRRLVLWHGNARGSCFLNVSHPFYPQTYSTHCSRALRGSSHSLVWTRYRQQWPLFGNMRDLTESVILLFCTMMPVGKLWGNAGIWTLRAGRKCITCCNT